MMAVPAVMIFLSLAKKPPVSPCVNVVFGALYTIIIVLIKLGASMFYFF